MSTYLADPKTLTDEQILGWLRNFQVEHPSLDNLQDRAWSQSIYAEARSRGLSAEPAAEPTPEPVQSSSSLDL